MLQMVTAHTEASTLESPVPRPITALVRLLDQLKDVIEAMDDRTFAMPPDGRPSGSIGAHVRHSLDHVSAFLDGAETGELSYDRRHRGTSDEASRVAALGRIDGLTTRLLDVDPRALERLVRVEVQLDPAGNGCRVTSSVARELTFVISHTVHHHATMALLLSDTGTPLPLRFGVAASTPRK